jgi:uncharacterized membrane protein
MAVAATVLLNFGFVLQKRGVGLAQTARAREGRSRASVLFATPSWRAGLGLMLMGWGLYLAAAKFAPISLIQPTLGVGFVALALFSVFYLREPMGTGEWVSLLALVVGVVLLGWSAGEVPAPKKPSGSRLALFTGAMLGLAILTYGLARGSSRESHKGLFLGLLAGVLIGIGSLFIKVMFNYLDESTLSLSEDMSQRRLLAFGLCLPVVIAGNVAGIAVIQRGFEHGKAVLVVPVQQVANKLLVIIGGIVVLGEGLPPDTFHAGTRIAAYVLLLASAGALARFSGEEMAARMEAKEENQKREGS